MSSTHLKLLALAESDTAWMRHANCLGLNPDWFFPERGASIKQAVAVCAACVVRHQCLDYALDNTIRFGIFGGKSERERRRMRRERDLHQNGAA